jgi:hypothetical protein
VRRLARIVFPYYWEVLALAGATGEWTLACWTWGRPASLVTHAGALIGLFAVNRLAAVAYEREEPTGPIRHHTGGFMLAGGFAAAGATAGLVVATLAWACVVRAGGLSAQAGTIGLPSFEWIGPEFRAVGWLGIAAGFGLVVDGYVRGHRRLEITRIAVALPGLPAALDGFRILHVSDLHLGPIADRHALRDAFDRAMDEAPDLVVVTGDIIDTPKADPALWLPELARLRARHGVLAILGNHDRDVGLDRVAATLRASTDWIVLRDDVHRVDTDGGTLYVAGLEFRRTPHEGDAVASLAAGLPPGAPALLLAHHPDAFVAAVAAGFGLTLCGHTHGGQIALPFAPRCNPARLLMTGYDAGTFVQDGRVLHVNRGLGTSGQRLRIAVPRELTVVTLRSPDVAT